MKRRFKDETEFLLSKEKNKKHLFEAMKEIDEGKIVEMIGQELLERFSIQEDSSSSEKKKS